VLQLPAWLKLSAVTDGNVIENKFQLNVTAAGLILQNIQHALKECATLSTDIASITKGDLYNWEADDIKQYLRYVSDWCDSDAIHNLIELFSSFPSEATTFMQETRHLAPTVQFTLKVTHDTPHAVHDEWVQCTSTDTFTAEEWVLDSKTKIIVVEESRVAVRLGEVYNDISNWFARRMFRWHWRTRGGTEQYKTYTDKRIDVTAHRVRLHGVAGIKTLQMAVGAANTMNNSDIFKSEVITAIAVLHWRLYANRSHLYSLVFYMILLVLFVYMTIYVETASTVRGYAIQAVKTLITGGFLKRELKECAAGPFSYISDMWNLMDLLAYLLTICATILQLFEKEPYIVMGMNAVAAVLLWFKLLHYMRPYRSTGPLVAMIFDIVRAMRAFMAVLSIVLIGFANAFYTILRTKTYPDSQHTKDSAGSYSTVPLSLRSIIIYVFAGWNLDELDAGPLQQLLSILLVIFIVIVSVVLLNVLIAIIVNRFDKLNREPLHHWRHEQSRIILARHARLSKSQQDKLEQHLKENPYLHMLRPTSRLVTHT
jgi:Ion transport protein